jgi:hypothetical protein
LEEMDYSDFRPKAPPPITAAKLAMIEAVRPEVEAWIEELPETAVECDIWTASKLTERFNNQAIRKVVPKVMGRLLSRKFPQCRRWRDSQTKAVAPRYFIVRNAEKWTVALRDECEAELMRGMKY